MRAISWKKRQLPNPKIRLKITYLILHWNVTGIIFVSLSINHCPLCQQVRHHGFRSLRYITLLIALYGITTGPVSIFTAFGSSDAEKDTMEFRQHFSKIDVAYIELTKSQHTPCYWREFAASKCLPNHSWCLKPPSWYKWLFANIFGL